MVKNIWINKIYSITMPKMHKIMSFIAIICVSFVRICHIAYLSCINLASLEKGYFIPHGCEIKENTGQFEDCWHLN